MAEFIDGAMWWVRVHRGEGCAVIYISYMAHPTKKPVGVMLGCCMAQRAVQWSLLTYATLAVLLVTPAQASLCLVNAYAHPKHIAKSASVGPHYSQLDTVMCQATRLCKLGCLHSRECNCTSYADPYTTQNTNILCITQ